MVFTFWKGQYKGILKEGFVLQLFCIKMNVQDPIGTGVGGRNDSLSLTIPSKAKAIRTQLAQGQGLISSRLWIASSLGPCVKAAFEPRRVNALCETERSALSVPLATEKI